MTFNVVVAVVVVVCLGLISNAAAQGMAPGLAPEGAGAPMSGGTDDCFSSLISMSDCLTYVEKGSNLTAPEKGCCPALAGLVANAPMCLCQLLGNSSVVGVPIDVNKALTLPKSCRVDTPPVSLCAAIGVPVGVPTASEGPGSSINGEGMSPTMTPGVAPPGSGASNAKGVSMALFFGLWSIAVVILV